MILLTFNISILKNNTDYNNNISNTISISSIEEQARNVLNLLEMHDYHATFFVEISIAEELQKLLKDIVYSGHEVALYNIDSDSKKIIQVKENLDQFLNKPIIGLRQKTHRISYSEINKLGFSYVSNIEGSKIDFLWRKLKNKPNIHIENEIVIVPESQSPYSQLPFNDYVLQIIPMKYYETMILESLKANDYVMIHANIWQLFSKENLPNSLPYYKKLNLGKHFEKRLDKVFHIIDLHEIAVSRMKDYLF